jgi:hypothetical protein
MAHDILREDRIWRPGERIFFQIEQARQIAEFADIRGGEDGGDTGQTARGRRYSGPCRESARHLPCGVRFVRRRI